MPVPRKSRAKAARVKLVPNEATEDAEIVSAAETTTEPAPAESPAVQANAGDADSRDAHADLTPPLPPLLSGEAIVLPQPADRWASLGEKLRQWLPRASVAAHVSRLHPVLRDWRLGAGHRLSNRWMFAALAVAVLSVHALLIYLIDSGHHKPVQAKTVHAAKTPVPRREAASAASLPAPVEDDVILNLLKRR